MTLKSLSPLPEAICWLRCPGGSKDSVQTPGLNHPLKEPPAIPPHLDITAAHILSKCLSLEARDLAPEAACPTARATKKGMIMEEKTLLCPAEVHNYQHRQ